jgi:hypothetical protein
LRIRGHLLLLPGLHGEFTLKTPAGIRTSAYERGVIQSVSGNSVIVKAADGTTWTWDLVGSTVLREHGAKTPQSSLAAGERVWVGGHVIQSAKDARLIIIRPPGSGATPASPAPTPSGT